MENKQISEGACIYCGQMCQFETVGFVAADQLNMWATEKCECGEAKEARKRIKAKNDAEKIVKEKYESTFPEAAELMMKSIDMIYKYKIDSMAIKVNKENKICIREDNSGKIRIERTITVKKVDIG